MLKYSLIIEGTAKELEDPKRWGLHEHLIKFAQKCSIHEGYASHYLEYNGVITQVEYQVVEPLRVETIIEIDNRGCLDLGAKDIDLRKYAGKKVKVVITEEE